MFKWIIVYITVQVDYSILLVKWIIVYYWLS